MEYIVKVCGEVVDSEYKTYAIKASSLEEAKKIAKQNFREDYQTNGNIMVVEKPIIRRKRAYFAIVAMIIAILLSFISWKHGHSTVSFSPDLISTLFAVLIYSAFVIRFKGIQRTVGSKIDIIFMILLTLLLSSFVKIILCEKEFTLFKIINFSVNTNVVLIVAVILSWLGLKLVSLGCVSLVIICALGNITSLNAAMGSFWGTVYVISSFLGIVMYSSVEPAFMDIKKYIYRFTKKSINYLERDVTVAKEHAIKIKNSVDNKGHKIDK